MRHRQKRSDQKMNISANYTGVCCPFHADGKRWGNRKRGGIDSGKQNTSFADHRRQAKKVQEVLEFERKRWSKNS